MTRGRAEIHDRRRYLAQGAYRVPISGLRCDTADEHQRFDKATRDLRNAAHPVEVYEITTLGRGALAVAECVDCFNDAEHGSMMCALCRARHVRPSGRRSGRQVSREPQSEDTSDPVRARGRGALRSIVGSVERPPLPTPPEPNDDTGVGPAPPETIALWVNLVGTMGPGALADVEERTFRQWERVSLFDLRRAIEQRRRELAG